jgi:hypothetical protein
MRFGHGPRCSYYRIVLPAQLLPRRFDREGTWHVLLKLGKLQLEGGDVSRHGQGNDRSIVQGLHAVQRPVRGQAASPAVDEHLRRFQVAERAALGVESPLGAAPGIRRRSVAYGLRVHAYSSVSLQAALEQSGHEGHEPGSSVRVSASLTQSGLPMSDQVAVWVEVTGPKGERSRRPMEALGEGRHALELVAANSGVHGVRVKARGRTRKGLPFTRERALNAVVWRGADRDEAVRGQDLLELLLSGGSGNDELEKQLLERGLDLERARKLVRRVPEEG